MAKGQSKSIEVKDVLLAQQGDKSALNRVVKQAHSLVWSLANRASKGSQISAEDLSQSGFVGLLKGLPKFNPDFGVKPATFLYNEIRSEIMKSVRFSGLVKGPRSNDADKAFWKIRQAERRLRAKQGSYTDQDVADALSISLESVQATRQATQAVASIHAGGGEGVESLAIEDKLQAQGLNPEESMGKTMEKQWVRGVLKSIHEECKDREKMILAGRIWTKDPVKGEVLADVLGITRQAVSMTEAKLRKRITKRLINTAR